MNAKYLTLSIFFTLVTSLGIKAQDQGTLQLNYNWDKEKNVISEKNEIYGFGQAGLQRLGMKGQSKSGHTSLPNQIGGYSQTPDKFHMRIAEPNMNQLIDMPAMSIDTTQHHHLRIKDPAAN